MERIEQKFGLQVYTVERFTFDHCSVIVLSDKCENDISNLENIVDRIQNVTRELKEAIGNYRRTVEEQERQKVLKLAGLIK